MRYLVEEEYLEEDTYYNLEDFHHYFEDEGVLYPNEELEVTEWTVQHDLWYAVLELALEDYKYEVDRMLDRNLSSNARIAASKKRKVLEEFFYSPDTMFQFICDILHFNNYLIRNRTLLYRQEEIQNGRF